MARGVHWDGRTVSLFALLNINTVLPRQDRSELQEAFKTSLEAHGPW